MLFTAVIFTDHFFDSVESLLHIIIALQYRELPVNFTQNDSTTVLDLSYCNTLLSNSLNHNKYTRTVIIRFPKIYNHNTIT